MHTYFAYGSNMDPAQMQRRVPGSKFLSLAVLKDFRPGFTHYDPAIWHGGVMDVLPQRGASVWGTVWQMPDSAMTKMDSFEIYYHRLSHPVVPVVGNVELPSVEAEIYEVTDRQPQESPPSKKYKN